MPDVIESVDTTPIQLPVRRNWRWTGSEGGVGTLVVVRVRTKDGIVGYGETQTFSDLGGDHGRYSGNSVAATLDAINSILAPILVGRMAADLGAIMSEFDLRLSGHLMTKAALEMAVLDIQGKASGLPVFRLLGGKSQESIHVAHTIGIMERADALDEATGALSEGCTSLHIKLTGSVDADKSLVRDIRQLVGPSVLLWVDANQGYASAGIKGAVSACQELAAAGADIIEQPSAGLKAMSAITRACPSTVIADESLWHPSEAPVILGAEAADGLSIYVSKSGGIASARLTASFCAIVGAPYNVNGAFVSGITNAASVQLATAGPGTLLPCPIPVSAPAGSEPTATVGRYFADDIIAEPFKYSDGKLEASGEPGLGIQIDESKVRKYAI